MTSFVKEEIGNIEKYNPYLGRVTSFFQWLWMRKNFSNIFPIFNFFIHLVFESLWTPCETSKGNFIYQMLVNIIFFSWTHVLNKKPKRWFKQFWVLQKVVYFLFLNNTAKINMELLQSFRQHLPRNNRTIYLITYPP